MVLWFGRVTDDGRARVARTYIPKQTAYRSKEGLSLRVDAQEMAAIAQLQRRETLIAQLHSHPTIAYHSALDEAKPVVTEDGGFSIVVPFFGFTSLLDLGACAVYQLQEGTFGLLPPSRVASLFALGR